MSDGFKFDLETTIYFMKENKVVAAKIWSRHRVDCRNYKVWGEDQAAAEKFGETRVEYSTVYGVVQEKDAFATKEELLASL